MEAGVWFCVVFFPLSYCGTRKFSAECKMKAKIGNRPRQTLKVKTKTLFISGNCGRYLKTGDVIQRDGLVKRPLQQHDE